MKKNYQVKVLVLIIFLAVLVFGLNHLIRAEMKTSVVFTPMITAKLVDPEKKAAKKSATVEVTATGIKLVDPSLANETPVQGEGHLHYQVDSGYIVATPASKLGFHGLTPGEHTITVMLAGNNHEALGPKQVLHVTIP